MMLLLGLVSYTLVLGITLTAARPHELGGGTVLCARAALDEDHLRGVLIQGEDYADVEDVYNEGDESQRGLEGEGDILFDGAVEDVSEDRTESDFKKIKRYIKRQLKVPKRYLRKILRTLTYVTDLRSIGGDGEMISIESPSGTGESGESIMVIDEPAEARYWAIITAPLE